MWGSVWCIASRRLGLQVKYFKLFYLLWYHDTVLLKTKQKQLLEVFNQYLCVCYHPLASLPCLPRWCSGMENHGECLTLQNLRTWSFSVGWTIKILSCPLEKLYFMLTIGLTDVWYISLRHKKSWLIFCPTCIGLSLLVIAHCFLSSRNNNW